MHYTKQWTTIKEKLAEIFGEEYPQFLYPKSVNLKDFIKKSGLTQKQLEELTGIDQPSISRAINHPEDRMASEKLYALSVVLRCKSLNDIAEFPENWPLVITPTTFGKIAPQILEVVNVRTLASPKTRVDLRTFYYQTRIIYDYSKRKISREVHNLRGLGHRPALIQGVAGQGKSIFLRYLTAKTFEEHSSLPLFFELRYFKGKTIRDTVAERLQVLGIRSDDKTLTQFLSEGRVSLLFDAYDELSQNLRTAFAEELGEMHAAFPKLRIVLSSRPHTGIIHDCLEVFEIEPIEKDEIINVVKCYATDDEAEDISERLHLASVKMIGLLSSPLMILLLVIHFRYTRSIPESVAKFYQDLFDVLVRRHNRSEGRLKRPITSGLNRRQLQLFFQTLCFLARQYESAGDIHISKLEDIASEALALCNIQASEHDALEDVVVITNLIVEEGGVCFYIHKTVQEYYAAAHVRSMALEEAEVFYAHRFLDWSKWDGEIRFLLIIDRLRCIKYFCMPDLIRCTPFTLESYLSLCPMLNFFIRVTKRVTSPVPYTMALPAPQAFCMRSLGGVTWHVADKGIRQMLHPNVAEQVLINLGSSNTVSLDRRLPFENHGKPNWDVSKLVHMAQEIQSDKLAEIMDHLEFLQNRLHELQADVEQES